MTYAYVPMPDTCHPAYERLAEGVRQHLDKPAVVIPRRVGSLSASFTASAADKVTSDITWEPEVLDVKKCWGPMPFVGDPEWTLGFYAWRVAVDKAGRHIAGPAVLTWSRANW